MPLLLLLYSLTIVGEAIVPVVTKDHKPGHVATRQLSKCDRNSAHVPVMVGHMVTCLVSLCDVMAKLSTAYLRHEVGRYLSATVPPLQVQTMLPPLVMAEIINWLAWI